MKLLLRRRQSKGVLGVTSFHLTARFELEDQELSLVDSCNMANEPLAHQCKEDGKGNIIDSAWAMKENNRLSVGKLITGYEVKSDYLTDILEIEETLKSASINFQKYLDIAATYGGEEVINIRQLVDQEE